MWTAMRIRTQTRGTGETRRGGPGIAGVAGIAAIAAIAGLSALAAVAAPAAAAAVTTPAALGMGSAYSAAARDYEAAHLNPANLALSGSAGWSLHLISLAGRAANSSLSISDYQRYNGAELDEEDKARIMSLIDGDRLRFDASGDVAGLSATYRGFAVTASASAFASGGLPRDLIELLLYGNELDRTYRIGDAAGEVAAISSIGLSASRALPFATLGGLLDELAVGGTFRITQGWYYARVLEADGTLVTTMDGLEGSGLIRLRTADGGSGTGLDLGLAARRGRLTLGLGFHDLAGSMTWKNGEDQLTTFAADSVTAEALGDDGDLIDQQEETVPVGEFEARVPATVRLGAAFAMGRWLIAGDYSQGWGGEGFTPRAAEVAGGVEHRTTGWLRLRSGFTAGPERSPGLSLGAGFLTGPVRIDLAIVSEGGVAFGQAEGVGVALGFGYVSR